MPSKGANASSHQNGKSIAASGRQNGSAKSLALFGKRDDAGSIVNKEKCAQEASKKKADSAAIKKALEEKQRQHKIDRSNALSKLAKANAEARKRPGFFYTSSLEGIENDD